MRSIHVFVLRLLSNTDDPDGLRGVLRPLDDDNDYAFADGQSLMTLLKHMSHAPHPLDADPEDAAHPADGSPKR
jgi:hypothetical protein